MVVRTVQGTLQEYCDILLQDAEGVLWDSYRLDQKPQLELKVRLALYEESVRADGLDGQSTIIEPAEDDREGQTRNTLVKHVSDKIWDQRKHTPGKDLWMCIIYIALVKEDSALPLAETNFMLRPLFRTKKCVDPNSGGTRDKCMVFVDEFGWVYQNWDAFTKETIYPATKIVAPTKGVFWRHIDDGRVKLTHFKAPKTAAQIEAEKYANIGLTIGGIGSAVVLASAAVFPITAPFVWGAIGVGSVIGAVTGVTSAVKLFDRSSHEQSISLADKESHAHWLSITGTLVGFMASGASAMVRSAATAGNVSKSMIYASNTIFGSSLIVNGASVGNSVWNVYSDDRPVTAGDIAQLSVSLFLFTHSVYNFQTARTMVRETQAQHLTDYKQTLSKNGQKAFRNRQNGRVRQNGLDQANGDTIRNLNTAEHYNNNFRGTDGHHATTGAATNPQLKQHLSTTFNRYPPQSLVRLAEINGIITRNVGGEYFEQFTLMAEIILDEYGARLNVSIDWVVEKCYNLVREYAERNDTTIREILQSFTGRGLHSIPFFVVDFFRARLAVVPHGNIHCEICQGMKYL